MKKKLYVSESALISRDLGVDMIASETPIFEKDRLFLIDEEYIQKKGNTFVVNAKAELKEIQE